MKRFVTLFAVLILFAACDQKEQPPVNADKMQKILTDLHVAEAYSAMVSDTLHIARNKNYDSLAVYYKDILSHHKVTEDEFIKGIDWYKRRPDLLDSVYVNVLNNLTEIDGLTPSVLPPTSMPPVPSSSAREPL